VSAKVAHRQGLKPARALPSPSEIKDEALGVMLEGRISPPQPVDSSRGATETPMRTQVARLSMGVVLRGRG